VKKIPIPVCCLLVLTALPLVADDRSFDGTGNNQLHQDWGAAGTVFQRLGPAQYADGIAALDESDRPNPRYISNKIASQKWSSMNRRGLSDLVWCWGQFLDHDLTLSLQDPAEPIPVMTESEDVLAPLIPVSRSLFDPSTGTSSENPRQQINHTTAFIDASNVYGNTTERAHSLRTFVGGKLIASENDTIPLNLALIEMENPNGLPLESLYMAGDVRANENPALISIHSLWLREHNRLTDEIAAANPEMTDEAIYQKARKIVSAEIQNITYNEFLVALLGPHAPTLNEAAYDPDLNPGMFNEVVAALYRIGHTMISSNLRLMYDEGTRVPGSHFRFMDVFFRPSFVDNPDFVGQLLKGLASKRMQEIDPMVIGDLRNALFGAPGSGGMDLITLNLQRARDHGLPGYNDTRATLGLSRKTHFSEITTDAGIQAVLAQVYADVDSVDLWIGAMAEDHLPEANVGELLATGLALQFRHLRDGDRFFFLYDDALSEDEKQKIRTTSFANVIERNTEMTTIQQMAFFTPDDIDSDGDRTTDGEELAAGTDPLDPDSIFQINHVSMISGQVVLQWNSVAGKSYRIQYRNSLSAQDAWQEISQTDALSSNTQFQLALQGAPSASGFYRVLTQP
jgi:peroxidase